MLLPILAFLFVPLICGERIDELITSTPVCTTAYSLKIEAETSNLPGNFIGNKTFKLWGTDTITFNNINVPAGTIESWTSSIKIDQIALKGGRSSASYVYTYNPEVAMDLTMIHTAPTGKNYASISYILICWDYELVVTINDATAKYDRTVVWTVQATGPADCLTSQEDAFVQVTINAVTTANYVLGNYSLMGSFMVTNPDPQFAAHIASISAVVGTTPVSNIAPLCVGVGIPANGGLIWCEYDTGMFPNNPGSTLRIIVTTTYGSAVQTGEGFFWPIQWVLQTTKNQYIEVFVENYYTETAQIRWYNVEQSTYPPLIFSVFFQDPGHFDIVYNVFAGTTTIQVAVCFDITANEPEPVASSEPILVSSSDYEPIPGSNCVLTQGYWKNHPEYWPYGLAGQGIIYYRSGVSWLQTYDYESTTAGCYWKVAHQLVAAYLNKFMLAAGGTSLPTEVASAIDQLDAILRLKTIDEFDRGSGCTKIYIPLHDLLERFNSGQTEIKAC